MGATMGATMGDTMGDTLVDRKWTHSDNLIKQEELSQTVTLFQFCYFRKAFPTLTAPLLRRSLAIFTCRGGTLVIARVLSKPPAHSS